MVSIGYDFSRLRNVKMTRKNNLVSFMLLIFLPTPLIIFLVFLILYLVGSPMDVNNVIEYPGSAAYEAFMIPFLMITGGITIALFLPILFLRVLNKGDFIYMGETLDMDKLIYFESKRRAVYISSKEVITYDKYRDKITKETSPSRIEEEQNKYVFWLNLEKFSDLKVKNTATRIVVKYVTQTGQIAIKKQFTLKLNNSGQIIGFNEMAYTYRYGNSNIKAMNHYHIEDSNDATQIPYHEKIKREILNTY